MAIIVALFCSIQSLLLPQQPSPLNDGHTYTNYNNYIIFAQSFYHLKNYTDLYTYYPSEYFDLYKYSPTFSVLFSAFAVFPNWLGLTLWNLLNVLLFLFAIYLLPNIHNKLKSCIFFACLIELITSVQNAQSNALIAALFIIAFGLLERQKYWWATCCITLTLFIKLFGIVAIVLYLLYPKKWKTIGYTITWIIIFSLLPLLLVDVVQYKNILLSWKHLLITDHATSVGYSVMGWLQTWFGIEIKMWTVVIGVIIFILPLLKIKLYKNTTFRLLMLASTLLWVVIFNHKAESPTFIIAIAGVAIWFFVCPPNALNIALAILALVLTSLSPTDIIPRYVREHLLQPYVFKVVPCIFIWVTIVCDMLLFHPRSSRLNIENHNP